MLKYNIYVFFKYDLIHFSIEFQLNLFVFFCRRLFHCIRMLCVYIGPAPIIGTRKSSSECLYNCHHEINKRVVGRA